MKKLLLLIILLCCLSISYASVPNGVHRWHFDNTASEPSNATYTADEWGSNHGNVTGPTFVADIDPAGDGGYNFDGNNDYILCGNITEIAANGPATVTFWIYSNGSNGDMYIYGHRSLVGGVAFRIKTTKVEITGTEYFNTASVNWTHNWHFVAMSWNGQTDTAKLYIDSTYYGVNDASGPNDIPVISNLVIGYDSSSINGTLDDFRLYNRVLSPDDVLELYNGTVEIDTGAHSNNAVIYYATYNNWYMFLMNRKNNAWLLLLAAAVIIIVAKKKNKNQS